MTTRQNLRQPVPPVARHGCTSLTERDHLNAPEPEAVSFGSDGFAAAMMMIAALPLSDSDKAEAVKRLLREAGW